MTSSDPAAPSTRVAELDGLRGVAVLSVIVYHYVIGTLYTVPGSLPAYVQKYFNFLWFGVDIFFVLSGYLVGGILLGQWRAKNCLRIFYLRRVLRILPPYFLLLSLFLIALGWWKANPGEGMRWAMEGEFQTWIYALFLQNFLMVSTGDFRPNFVGPTWSLAVEEQFYILFPLLLWLCRPRWLPGLLVALVLAAPFLRAVAFLGWADAFMVRYVLLPMRWDSLFFGALTAWAMRDPTLLAWCTDRLRLLRSLLALACVLMAVVPLIGNMRDHPTVLNVATYHSLIAGTVALTIALLRLGELGRLRAILRVKGLRSIGRISYSIYLFHQPILGLIFGIGFDRYPTIQSPFDWMVVVAAFGLTILMAQVTWWLFEEGLIRFGHRFSYTPAAPAATRPVPTQ